MEHILLSEITIGSKELGIFSAQLDNKLIVHAKQVSTSIDIRGHGDREFPFGSRKSCDEMSIDFRQNTNNGLPMNILRAIRSITPQITSTEIGTEIGRNSDEGTPLRNIGSFGLFGIGVSDLSYRSA